MGFDYTDPQGAYYVMVNVGKYGVTDDIKFCEWMAREVGVGAVPGSSFFNENINNYVRFHFAKSRETLTGSLLTDLKLSTRLLTLKAASNIQH